MKRAVTYHSVRDRVSRHKRRTSHDRWGRARCWPWLSRSISIPTFLDQAKPVRGFGEILETDDREIGKSLP